MFPLADAHFDIACRSRVCTARVCWSRGRRRAGGDVVLGTARQHVERGARRSRVCVCPASVSHVSRAEIYGG